MISTSLGFFAAGATDTGLGVDWSVLGIVLLGVAVLMVVIRAIGVVAAQRIPSAGAAEPSDSAIEPERAQPIPGEVTPELVAVLTAAATAVLGSPVRLISIRPDRIEAQRNWSTEGRREIYMSHRIR